MTYAPDTPPQATPSCLRALGIAAAYAVFAGIWIYTSDEMVGKLTADPTQRLRWSVYTGWIDVAITAILLFLLLRRVFGAFGRSYQLMQEREKEQARLRRAEELAASEKRFSNTMIESMPGILYFYDQRGQFLRWNRNFERLSGYSAAEIAGMHPLEFFEPDHKADVADRIAEVFEHGESSVSAPFLAKNGRTTPCLFTGRRVEFEGRTCLVGVGIDITERKRAEDRAAEVLRTANATLEQRVAERTAELEAARVRAEAADRLKSAFLATMSHELRTPLNSIIGFTGIVLQGLAGPLNEEQARQLAMVRRSALHLLDLINDVLDISKIEAGQLQIRHEAFSLPDAISHVVAVVRPLAERKNLGLTCRLDPTIDTMVGDRRRVEQILLNLLNNAIKFTEVGRVTLAATPIPDWASPQPDANGTAVRIAIADTGIGIKPEDRSKLFQPFRQVDTGLARLHEGTGLGLAICRRLAELMGGEISVVSEWGRGSEFTVTLPLRKPFSA